MSSISQLQPLPAYSKSKFVTTITTLMRQIGAEAVVRLGFALLHDVLES